MGRVVIGNAVDVETFASATVDGSEKLEKFLMAMLRHAAPDDLAVQYVKRGEQGRRAVAFVVMRHGSGPSLFLTEATRLATVCTALGGCARCRACDRKRSDALSTS